MSVPLHNYLRTYRKRAHLSQDDVAFLLGGEVGTTVSRHEVGSRIPSLETALAYEAVLGAPIRELFAGKYTAAESLVRERAGALLARVQRQGGSTPRLETLASLASLEEPITIPLWQE